jgi:hypothetical protein
MYKHYSKFWIYCQPKQKVVNLATKRCPTLASRTAFIQLHTTILLTFGHTLDTVRSCDPAALCVGSFPLLFQNQILLCYDKYKLSNQLPI